MKNREPLCSWQINFVAFALDFYMVFIICPHFFHPFISRVGKHAEFCVSVNLSHKCLNLLFASGELMCPLANSGLKKIYFFSKKILRISILFIFALLLPLLQNTQCFSFSFKKLHSFLYFHYQNVFRTKCEKI